MRLLSLLTLLAAGSPAVAQWKLDDKFKAAKPADLQDAPSTPPPAGAIILFDGKSLDAWTKTNGQPAAWKLTDGVMETAKGAGDIVTREKFAGTLRLHVEFRVPYEPGQKGQGRGNSGVYLQGRYEVQVLESYGLKPSPTDCAGIYEVAAPTANVCKAPTVWQSYDITFTAPTFAGGKKTAPARMTVVHNGVTVHDEVKIPVDNTRSGLGGDPATPGPILLQDHGHPVQYRNVWLTK